MHKEIQKQIISMGDIEIGGGTLTDDFIADKRLAHLIRSLARRKHPVDLILNGDTFDFLKCPFLFNGKKSYPRHITEDISLTKLALMYKAHKRVFEALKTFVRRKDHQVYFIIGNHDHDLFFKGVQQKIKEYISTRRNVHFTLFYKKHRVYAEHGQQYDFLNHINARRPFLPYNGTKILNIPWISMGLISNFMKLKEVHPFMERIVPLPVMFSHNRSVAKKISWRTLEYFLKSVIYYPLRYWYDPTYNLPRQLFSEFYRRLRNVHWDVDKIVDKFKLVRWRLLRQHKILILGHIHERYIEQKDNWVLLHTDTWRDEYMMDQETKSITSKAKRYVEINVLENEELVWELKESPGKRSVWNFENIKANEVEFITKAAKEEGFMLRLI